MKKSYALQVLVAIFFVNTCFSTLAWSGNSLTRAPKHLKQTTQKLLEMCKTQLLGSEDAVVPLEAPFPPGGVSEAQRKQWIRQVFNAVSSVQFKFFKASSFDARVIRAFQKSIEKNALEACAKESTCTKEVVVMALVKSIDDFYKSYGKLKKGVRVARGVVVLAATVFATVYAISLIQDSLPASFKWLTVLVPILTGIALTRFGAPFLDSVNSFSTSTAFRLKTGKSLFDGDQLDAKKLNELYDGLQAEFNPNQQAARTYLLGALGAIRGGLKEFLDLSAAGKRDQALLRFSEVIILVRKYYPAILDDSLAAYDDVLRSTNMLFVDQVPDVAEREKVYSDLMVLIEKYDEDFNKGQLKDLYRDVLRDWFALPTDYDWILLLGANDGTEQKTENKP